MTLVLNQIVKKLLFFLCVKCCSYAETWPNCIAYGLEIFRDSFDLWLEPKTWFKYLVVTDSKSCKLTSLSTKLNRNFFLERQVI